MKPQPTSRIVTRKRKDRSVINGQQIGANIRLDQLHLKSSKAECDLDLALQAAGFGGYEREYRFHPTRRWRFDFCWPHEDVRLAVEVEGGVYVSGRHTRGAAFEADAEKYAEAMLAGWRLLRVTPRHIRSGQAIEWIERALK